MEVKGIKVKVGIPASTEVQANLFEHISVIDSSLNINKVTLKDLSKAAALQEFLHAAKYVFSSRNVAVLIAIIVKNIRLEFPRVSILTFHSCPYHV